MSRPLQILGRDEHYVFVAKPPGVVSIPGRAPGQDEDVATVLASQLGGNRPMVIHRLDRDTSGVMVLAMGVEAHRAANAAFESHQVRKSYLAVVTGAFSHQQVVDAPLGPDPEAPRGDRGRQAVDASGRPARTVLAPVWTGRDRSLVAARPSTGRTHQVRVHLAHAGHPLVGDTSYGGPADARVFLHAAALSFFALGAQRSAHSAPWADMADLLQQLGAPVPDPLEADALLTAAARRGASVL